MLGSSGAHKLRAIRIQPSRNALQYVGIHFYLSSARGYAPFPGRAAERDRSGRDHDAVVADVLRLLEPTFRAAAGRLDRAELSLGPHHRGGRRTKRLSA